MGFMRCGRIKPQTHQRRKRATFGPTALPPAPASWSPPGTHPHMFNNDQYGDCTKANLANLLMQQAVILGRALDFTTEQVVASYFASSGGQDSGLCEVDVLAEAEEQGFCGELVGAVLTIDPSNQAAARALCAIFGGLYIGAELPARGQLQLAAGEAWDVPALLDDSDQPGSWGGHAMYVAGFESPALDLSKVPDSEVEAALAAHDARPGGRLGTWGNFQRATPAWWRSYVDEAYVVVPRADLLAATPERLEQLTAILAAAVTETPAP
jgi:hypothetical protein